VALYHRNHWHYITGICNIDTSVIGGYFDDEFEDASKRLFTRIANRDFDVYFSEVNET
jgi:predicted nucleic acid-binding protein